MDVIIIIVILHPIAIDSTGIFLIQKKIYTDIWMFEWFVCRKL